MPDEEKQEKAAAPELPDVTLTRGSVTVGDKVTGLARVLIQRDAIILADDIADSALDAARRSQPPKDGGRNYDIRIVSDPSALEDLDVYRGLRDGHTALKQRLDAFSAPPVPKPKPKPGLVWWRPRRSWRLRRSS